MNARALVSSIVVLMAAASSAATGQGPMTLYPPAEVQWKDGPPSLPKGVRMAILEGETEHATVISGVLHLGMGDRFDRSTTRALPAGTFGFWPAGTRHFAWMEGETILQLHGQGPWTVTYVDPADDPRKATPR